MKTNTRRLFLRQAATLAASVACANALPSWALAAQPASRPRAWITAGHERFQPLALQPWQAASSSPDVEIDPSQRFQSILGFGAAFTDASCYLFSRMEPAARQQLMEEFFGPSGLRLSIGRTCIGSSDYSRNAYSFDDSLTPDPELKNFSIAHDQAYILPVLREAAKVNPELFLFSAPWSPPGWMKSGGSMLGGSMSKKYFAAYAQYFVKFLQAYKAEGVNIQAITTQNEVDTDQDGRMPAALWGQEYELGFIKQFLGPALRAASLDTKIWILDHNYNLWGRVLDQLSDPDFAQYVEGVAWHGYVGAPDAMTKVHNAFPAKNAYWTEGGPDYTDPDYASDWTKWSSTYAGILKNWARSIVGWNFVLDEKGSPNIGPFNCGGMVTLDSKTRQISRSGQYWAFAHYSKVVRRGAQVVATKSNLPGVEHVAFVNPEGDSVLVLTNQGASQTVVCRCAGQQLSLDMPKGSIITLQWS
jgi:glucosylceramidase